MPGGGRFPEFFLAVDWATASGAGGRRATDGYGVNGTGSLCRYGDGQDHVHFDEHFYSRADHRTCRRPGDTLGRQLAVYIWYVFSDWVCRTVLAADQPTGDPVSIEPSALENSDSGQRFYGRLS